MSNTNHRLPPGPRPYLYFAYGSNMNVDQMMRRCPKARPVRRFTLPNLRLVFNGIADVVDDPDSCVNGALWAITDECERALNTYEGYKVDQSGLYVKEFVDDAVFGRIMYYKMNPRRKHTINPPSPFYFETILEGYRDFKVDEQPLLRAVNTAVETSERRTREVKHLVKQVLKASCRSGS